MKKIISLLLLTLFASFTQLSYAQVSATIKLEPKNPAPKSTLTLTLESYAFSVNTAMITWKSGGKTLLQGEGAKKLTIRTGEVGEVALIEVTAVTSDGSSVSQSIAITPSSVSILYEAPKSYTPLLYEGRSLPSIGGVVHVVAVPSLSDGAGLVPPSSLSYSWYVNDNLIESASGVGKQAANLTLDYLSTKTDIRVLALSPVGNKGEKTITIYPHAVMPLLYTYDEILGSNFSKAIDKRYEAVGDFIISLEPFYASSDVNKPLSSVWYLNGVPATPLGGKIMAFHPKENDYGSKILTIDVSGSSKYLQKAQVGVELIFDTRK